MSSRIFSPDFISPIDRDFSLFLEPIEGETPDDILESLSGIADLQITDEKKPTNLIEQGHLKFNEGKFDEAIVAYQKAIISTSIDSEKSNAYSYIGVSYEKQFDFKQAFDCYKKAFSFNSLALDHEVNLFYKMLSSHKKSSPPIFDLAFSPIFADYEKIKSDPHQSYTRIIHSLLLLKKIDLALDFLKQYIKSEKIKEETLLKIISYFEQQNNSSTSLSQNENSMQSLAIFYLEVTKTFFENSHAGIALFYCQKGLAIQNVKNELKASFYMLLAEYYRETNQLELVQDAFEEICKLPYLPLDNRIAFYIKLLEVVLFTQQYSRGFAYCDELLKLTKEDPLIQPIVHFFRGAFYEKTQMLDAAVEEFLVALKLNPTFDLSTMIYGEIAKVYIQKKQFSEALGLYQKSLEHPSNDAVLKGKIYNEMAVLYYELKHVEDAIKLLDLAKNLEIKDERLLETIEKNYQYMSAQCHKNDSDEADSGELMDTLSQQS